MIAQLGMTSPGMMNAGFLFGLMLLAAIVGGYAARFLHVPRVVGYLVSGVGLKYGLMAAGGSEGGHEQLAGASEPLGAIKVLALGLIMFSIGGVFERGHLRSVGGRMIKICIAESGIVFLLVGVGCSTIWALTSSAATASVLSAGVLLGVVGIATAPAATLLVLREYESKGPVSDTILTLTALNNTVCIVLFHCLFLILSGTGLIESTLGTERILWLDLVLTTVGSISLGIILGFTFSVLYSKLPLPEFVLIFLAVMLGLGAGEEYLAGELNLSFNFLLTSLCIGAVFTNITLNQDGLHESLRPLTVPIFAGFFVLAGYELHIDELGSLGLLGVGYVTLRVVGKAIGGKLGTKWAADDSRGFGYLGWGMLCQAGVAIGLADFLSSTWSSGQPGPFSSHALASQFKTVVLGSVVVFELSGPVILKTVVKRSGEVKAISLLRRRRSSPAEGDSITRMTFDALLRLFGFRGRSSSPDDALEVRHIMRSNIKLLPASSNLDEVLHFVEGSRFNHFPVVDKEGDYVGMIHFADLRDMIYDPHLRDLVMAVDLADPSVSMVPVDMSLDELLEQFKGCDTGSLVVVESAGSRRVVGVVEQRDLLRTLHGQSKTAAN